ncbi:glutamyl-tRNA reductase [Actinomadura spongiicola]|uniref:Glutamyl-tRNA reductase n=2 Tax=Actinomadura spongiicola TaxID=2303421 RepID=A0A372GCC6_9ACTN|nr:glutamyl-tRNA reductase [Actinomadura spongiicola]
MRLIKLVMRIHHIGIDHRTAPIALLERLVIPRARLPEALRRISDHPGIGEVVLLTTCHRLEAYVATDRHSEATCHVVDAFAGLAGVPAHAVWESASIRRETEAVTHLFRVVCGLESMAVGEEQIVAQVRAALRRARAASTAGPVLTALTESALRVSKQARTETRVGRAGVSLVHAAFDVAAGEHGGLAGRTALVVGTGTMGALAARLLRDRGAGDVHITSRTHANAVRLAEEVGGTATTSDAWDPVLERCDLVVTSTGAQGHVLDADRLRVARKAAGNRPMVALDLAMPRDIDPLCADVEGVRLIDIEELGRLLTGHGAAGDVARTEEIVTEQAAVFLARRLEATVKPLIVALRGRAREVVDQELARLAHRLPDMADRERAETVAAVDRIVGKLLHTPIVRAKQLSTTPEGRLYLEALFRLFDLDLSEANA